MEEKKNIKLPDVIYVNPRRVQNKMTPSFDKNYIYEAHAKKQESFVRYVKVTEEKKGK